MMRLTLALITIAFVSTAAGAQVSTSNSCRALQAAVEDSEKEMSAQVIDGLFDDSTPRATMREGKIGNQLELVSLNLSLITQAHCPPRREPIVTNMYISPALACHTQITKGVTDAPECNRDMWQRRVTAILAESK
jgi:hypothetical protein